MQTPQPNNQYAVPLSIGSVLGRTMSTLKKNPVVYFGLAFIAALPYALTMLLAPENIAVTSMGSIIQSILGLIIQGAIAYAVYQSLVDKSASIGDAMSRGLAHVGALFVASVLMGLGVAVGLLLLIIPGVILMCVWAVTIPACVVEKLGAIDSLKRSAELTKGFRLQIFGVVLIVNLILFGLTMFITVVLVGALQSIVVMVILLLAINLFYTAFNAVMMSVIYYDLRVVKEGISLDSLANVFD